MNYQEVMGVVVDAPIHSPFQQGKGLVCSKRLEGNLAIEYEDALRPDPAAKAFRRRDFNVKVTECRGRFDRKLVVQREQPFRHRLKGASY